MATERNIIRKIVVCLVSSLVTSFAVLVERCPTDRAERVARAIKICSSIERYHCMFNTERLLQEECIDYKQLPPGHYPIYNSFATGNPIDYEICPLDRYQPWPAKSYEITECVSTKSHCASEGQVLCNTGSTSVDIICQCDNKKGYSSASGKCCNPLGQEDCSCFKKNENDNIEPFIGCICVETSNSSETSKRVVNTSDDTSLDTRYTIGNDDNRNLVFSDGNPMFIAVASSTFILFLILCYILHIELYRYWNYIMTLVLTFLIIGCCVLNIFLYKDKVFHPLLGLFITTLVAVTVCITGIFIAFYYSTREENKVYNEDYELRIFRLLQAAAKGDVDELKRFAEEKYIDMDATDYDGRNALHVAVCAGRVEVVEYILINNYCILKAADKRGRSAYDYASEYEGNNQQKIKELLEEKYKGEHLAKTSKKKFKDSIAKDLIDAATIGDETILKRLRDEGTDMNLSHSDGSTALHTAVKYGHNNIVKYLLDECKVSPFIRSQDKRPDHVDWQNIASSKNEKIEEKLRKTMKEMLRSKDDAKDQRPPEEDLQIVRLFHCAAVGDIQQMRLYDVVLLWL